MDAAAAADRRSREWSGAYWPDSTFPIFDFRSGFRYRQPARLAGRTPDRLEIPLFHHRSRGALRAAVDQVEPCRLRNSENQNQFDRYSPHLLASGASDAADQRRSRLYGDERLQVCRGQQRDVLRQYAPDGFLYVGPGVEFRTYFDRLPLQRAVRFEKCYYPTEEAVGFNMRSYSLALSVGFVFSL